MFGYLARLLKVHDYGADYAAERIQQANDKASDPPWDTAGYGIARKLFDHLTDREGKKVEIKEFCDLLKQDADLWKAANDTEATPSPGSKQKYPPPDAKGYKKCIICPDPLPRKVRTKIPGGPLGEFPDVSFWGFLTVLDRL